MKTTTRRVQIFDTLDKKFLKWIIRIYVLGVFGANVLRDLGCVSFSSLMMNDFFGSCVLFLVTVLVYECEQIQEDEKDFLMGVTLGTMASTFDDKCFLLIFLFIINFMWIEIFIGNRYKNVVRRIVRIAFYSMTVLEIYSIGMSTNEYLVKNKINPSFTYSYMDCIYVITGGGNLVLNNNDMPVCMESAKIKKQIYQQKIRRYIWCSMIIVVIWLVISTIYSCETLDIGKEFYFCGKNAERGYLLSEDVECIGHERLCYVIMQEGNSINDVGSVIENPQCYDYVEMLNESTSQCLIVYLSRIIYFLQYHVISVCVLVLGLIYMLFQNAKKRELKIESGKNNKIVN